MWLQIFDTGKVTAQIFLGTQDLKNAEKCHICLNRLKNGDYVSVTAALSVLDEQLPASAM